MHKTKQATRDDGGLRNLESSELPILVHTSVLGVDIAVSQEAIWAEVHEDGYDKGGDADVEITAWQGEFQHQYIRYELAAWARRNLFNGAGPA